MLLEATLTQATLSKLIVSPSSTEVASFLWSDITLFGVTRNGLLGKVATQTSALPTTV